MTTPRRPLAGRVTRLTDAAERRDAALLLVGFALGWSLLPEGAVDPWGLVEPRRVLGLVALVVAVQGVGHLLLRLLRGRGGLVLAGIAAGFASSTAAIGGLGALARRAPAQARDAAVAGLASNLGTLVQMTLLLALGAPGLLARLAPALALAAATLVLLVLRRLRVRSPDAVPPVQGRAFSLRQALVFLAAIAGVSAFALLVLQALGEEAVPLALATAGLVDPHAAAAASMQLVHAGRLDAGVAADAIGWALLANFAVKGLVARASGGPAYARHLLPGLAACGLALVAGAALAPA